MMDKDLEDFLNELLTGTAIFILAVSFELQIIDVEIILHVVAEKDADF